jgi:hypothetical protein
MLGMKKIFYKLLFSRQLDNVASNLKKFGLAFFFKAFRSKANFVLFSTPGGALPSIPFKSKGGYYPTFSTIS